MKLIQALIALAALGFSLLNTAAVMAADDKGNAMAVNAANSNNLFVLDLYAKLQKQPGNIIASPYSIAAALAMTYEGARGQTALQMKQTLHLPDGDAGSDFAILNQSLQHGAGYELNVANALWGQKGYEFLNSFTDELSKQFDAALHEVDFEHATEASRKTINAWVEKQTHDKIKDLLQPGVLSDQTRLVLVNAIYFKGKWVLPFKKERTREAPFTVLGNAAPIEPVKAQMMQQTASFPYMHQDGLSILEMPYIGEALSMVILLPDIEGKAPELRRAALADLESKMTADNLTNWLGQLQKHKVEVYLPRFTATAEFQLKPVLQQLGMMNAFALPTADFSGMNGKRDLYISDVVHKAFVEVNEEGTEAAAATGVMVTGMAVMRNPIFRADHSFVFFIRDTRSGAILFMGRIENPAEAKN